MCLYFLKDGYVSTNVLIAAESELESGSYMQKFDESRRTCGNAEPCDARYKTNKASNGGGRGELFRDIRWATISKNDDVHDVAIKREGGTDGRQIAS